MLKRSAGRKKTTFDLSPRTNENQVTARIATARRTAPSQSNPAEESRPRHFGSDGRTLPGHQSDVLIEAILAALDERDETEPAVRCAGSL
jgi:hypothetical protein